MALILRPALWTPATESWLALPPLSGSLRVTERRAIELADVPLRASGQAGVVSLYNRRHGWDISFAARYRFSTAALGLAFQDQLKSMLIDTAGRARAGLTFAWWTDTEGSIKRYYRDCILAAPLAWAAEAPGSDRYRTYRFELVSTSAEEFATAPDGTTAPAGPYEYAVPGGDEAEEIPGVPEGVIMSYRLTHSAAFDGVIEATNAANRGAWQHAFALPGPSGATVTVRSVQINRADNAGASGTSTVRVSNADYAGAGNAIDASVGASQTVGARVSGEIEGVAGETFYVFWTAAGGHSDPKVTIELEVG